MINLSAMDMGMSIGFFAMFILFGSLDYSTIFSLAPYMNENAITIIALLLFSGAMAKSAQVPLHSWLPGSMEATLIFKNIFIILLIIFLYYFQISKTELFINFNLLCINLILPIRLRDKKGRFKAITKKEDKSSVMNTLPNAIVEPLIGNLLGDGHLRFTHKKPNTNLSSGNALYTMTLKNKEYIYYLWGNIYGFICTKTIPRPWPSIKSGKPASQYTFHTKSLPYLSLLHYQWYKWSNIKQKYIKIVPKNIDDLLTPIGLAHWIMDDGYKSGGGVVLCTESFSLSEIKMLKNTLISKFDLIATLQKRYITKTKISYRIYISSTSHNKLISLVSSYFIPSMKYKLGL